MSDFFIDSSDSKFVISSGSDDVPILTVSGSTVYVSGSLVPGDATVTSPVSELGSLHKPWKELYVESGSINFVKADEALDASDRNVTFNRADVEDVLAGRPPRGVLPLSRFALSLSFEARISAANTWYGRARSGGGMGGLLSISFATSDPNGGNITAQSAMTGQVFIAPRDLEIHRATCYLMNSHNNDNIIVTMFKGTTTDDNASLNNIGLTRIGTTFAPTMARRKTYVVNQNLTSNNQMSAGEGLIITAHVTSHTSTSYPNILITLDGQYR